MSKISLLPWSGSDEGSLPNFQMTAFLLCPQMSGRERLASDMPLFNKDSSPIVTALPS